MSDTEPLHTAVVIDAHAYTRSKTPWLLESCREKLFRYLSGGGLCAFGRTVRQEESDAKRDRFLAAAAVAGVAWLVLLVA